LINDILAELVKKQALKIVHLPKAKGTEETEFYALGDKSSDFERKEDDR